MAVSMILQSNQSFYVASWTTGCKKSNPAERPNDDAVLAQAMWLANHGKEDDAEELIERWCKK